MQPNKEQISIYLQRRQADYLSGQEALAKPDFFVLEKIGHQMKGNGLSFGFPELSVLGEKLEDAAQVKDISLLSKLMTMFESWLKSKN